MHDILAQEIPEAALGTRSSDGTRESRCVNANGLKYGPGQRALAWRNRPIVRNAAIRSRPGHIRDAYSPRSASIQEGFGASQGRAFGPSTLHRTMNQIAATPSFQPIFFPSA